MVLFRKQLLVILPVVGVTLFAVSHLAGDGSLLAAFGPKVSFIFFFGTLVLVLMPAHSKAVEATAIKPVSRHLPSDVLNDQSLALSFPKRIEAAIELSKQQSRMLGVIAVRLDDCGLASQLGEAARQAALTTLAANLRRSLRKTDTATVHAGEVIVAMPLIGVRRDLDTIAVRLDRTIATTLAEIAPDADEEMRQTDLGIAMYPIGGYSGEELIETALTAAIAARAKRLGRPVVARAKSKDPAPVMPPRKIARPRRRASASSAAAR